MHQLYLCMCKVGCAAHDACCADPDGLSQAHLLRLAADSYACTVNTLEPFLPGLAACSHAGTVDNLSQGSQGSPACTHKRSTCSSSCVNLQTVVSALAAG